MNCGNATVAAFEMYESALQASNVSGSQKFASEMAVCTDLRQSVADSFREVFGAACTVAEISACMEAIRDFEERVKRAQVNHQAAKDAAKGAGVESGAGRSSIFTEAQAKILRALNEWFASFPDGGGFKVEKNRKEFDSWRDWSRSIETIGDQEKVLDKIEEEHDRFTAGGFLEKAVQYPTEACFYKKKEGERTFSGMNTLRAPPVIIFFVYEMLTRQTHRTETTTFSSFTKGDDDFNLLSEAQSHEAATKAVELSKRSDVKELIASLDLPVTGGGPPSVPARGGRGRRASDSGSGIAGAGGSMGGRSRPTSADGSAGAVVTTWIGFSPDQKTIVEAMNGWYSGLGPNSAMNTMVPKATLSDPNSAISKTITALKTFMSSGKLDKTPFGNHSKTHLRSTWEIIQVFAQDVASWCFPRQAHFKYKRLATCSVPREVIFFVKRCVDSCGVSLEDFSKLSNDEDISFMGDSEATSAARDAIEASGPLVVTQSLLDLDTAS